VILWASLDHYLGLLSRQLGRITPETRADLVAEKTSDLAVKIEGGEWTPERESSRVAGYVQATARNALVDHLRRYGAVADRSDEEEGDENPLVELVADARSSPWSGVRAEEFVTGLVGCLEPLTPRERRIWELRVLHELPTKEIAAYPGVRSSVTNVDVTLYRLRRRVRACMGSKGLDTQVLPPGTWARLWIRLRDWRRGGD
jgi:RNA polymerase sigma factor (sigma-70 family)